MAAKFVVMMNIDCVTSAEVSSKKHETKEKALEELYDFEDNPKFAGCNFWIKKED